MPDEPDIDWGNKSPHTLSGRRRGSLLTTITIVLLIVAAIGFGYMIFNKQITGAFRSAGAEISEFWDETKTAVADLGKKRPAPAPKAPPAEAKATPATVASPAAVAAAPEASAMPVATPASPRSPYKGFYYGLSSDPNVAKEQLAQLIENHIKAGKKPTDKLDEVKCAKDSSCASPMDYIVAYRAYDPKEGLTDMSQLPAYFRKLVVDCSIRGRFMMADIFLPVLSGIGVVETNRMSRELRSNECVLKNPTTGQPVIALFCANPVGKRVAPPKPPCYIIPFDYRHQRDIVPVKGAASVSGHYGLTQAEVNAIVDDECTFVKDGRGVRKPGLGPCTINCPPGGMWPPPALAAAVNLPRERLRNGGVHGQIHFLCTNGQCELSLPAWALRKLNLSVYCVLVDPYAVSTPGFEGLDAVSRYDPVLRAELLRTAPAGRLGRTLKGARSF